MTGSRLEGVELLNLARRVAADEGLECAAGVPLSGLNDRERLDVWLAAGHAGEMDYLERHVALRGAPAEHFPPHLSALVFLARYDPTPPLEGGARIARYAQGDDYHRVLRRGLERVAAVLKSRDPSLEARPCVDTAPLHEKIAAARAGLGWQGKNTNVIRPGTGSFFFLAELLVNRIVPVPEGAIDRCGTCRACLDACPTDAFPKPYVLDARRCVSYLTIEKRGAIPEELRAGIGDRIFGCDDCQDVCPWNREAEGPGPIAFRPRPGLRERTLRDWLAVDREDWTRIFRQSAAKRAKFEGFKRNVAVALGNRADPADVAAIETAFFAEPPLARAHLAWALGRMPLDAGREALLRLRSRESDAEVLIEIDHALESPDAD